MWYVSAELSGGAVWNGGAEWSGGELCGLEELFGLEVLCAQGPHRSRCHVSQGVT